MSHSCDQKYSVGLQNHSPGKCLGADLAGLVCIYINNYVIQGRSRSIWTLVWISLPRSGCVLGFSGALFDSTVISVLFGCSVVQLSVQSANSISRSLFNSALCCLKPVDQENGMIFPLSQCSHTIQLGLRNTRESAIGRQRCGQYKRTKEERWCDRLYNIVGEWKRQKWRKRWRLWVPSHSLVYSMCSVKLNVCIALHFYHCFHLNVFSILIRHYCKIIWV